MFVERFIILCPYLGESAIGGFIVHVSYEFTPFSILYVHLCTCAPVHLCACAPEIHM